MPRGKTTEPISTNILKLLALGTIITVSSILSPRLPYAIIKQGLNKKYGRSYTKTQISNAVGYLRRKKFVSYKNNQLILTDDGKELINKQHDKIDIKIKKIAWDNKWRLVMFDIPEEYKNERLTFLRYLKSLELFHFQRSILLSPYPCESEINKLAKGLGIAEYVHVLTAERFSNDNKIKNNFSL